MKSAAKVASAPSKPLLVYDGDCNFCKFWVVRWRHVARGAFDSIASQDPQVPAQFPELGREQLDAAVQYITVEGDVYSGAEAVFRSLSSTWWGRTLVTLHAKSALFAGIAERSYEFVAGHRSGLSRINRFLWGRAPDLPDYSLVRWVFLRFLGIIYLFAFLSLGSQILGLIGSDGISPAAEHLKEQKEFCEQHGIGIERFQLLPTLCWFGASDGFLKLLCYGGSALACLLILNIAPAACLFLLWLIYLSLSNVCGVFLGYQWDALLLEVGFLAIFLAPLQLWPRHASTPKPSRTALLLLRWLLFLLMFESGVVKLASQDPTWHQLTALNFHYETQPLPTWIAWYANQLPEWFQHACVAAMFGIELGVPFLIFAPRRLRFVAGGLLLLLQILIFLTGNYCFFNLLTIALCVLLLDDSALAKFIPRSLRDKFKRDPAQPTPASKWRWPRWVTIPFAIFFVIISVSQLESILNRDHEVMRPISAAEEWAYPLRTLNTYGLFARMTTNRIEIVVEGSNDATNWLAYEFNHKPGDVGRRPAFVAPHQPRLDWQMWFAALGTYRENPWLVNFCVRLLQGSRPVLDLIGHNPFPGHPPRYIRAVAYEYHFTNFAERRASGAWWKREYLGLYLPVISLREKQTAADERPPPHD